MERALEKIKGLKSCQWLLKRDKISPEKVLEYWKQSSVVRGTCFGQASALLHAEVREGEIFSLEKSYRCLNLEEIISRHCSRRLSSLISEKKNSIATRFKQKQIMHRIEQWKQQLIPLLHQACTEFNRGVPKEECFRPLKQWAEETSDPNLELAVDKLILAVLRPWYQRHLIAWLGINQEWESQVKEWFQNVPEISASEQALKLEKYEKEGRRLAYLEPGSWDEIFECIDVNQYRRCDDPFLTDSPPGVYQEHLEKAIASFPSRTRDGVITGTIILPDHIMAFQYGPEEYFMYDTSLEQHGLFKYPNKESFFKGMYLIIQNFVRHLSHQDLTIAPIASFQIFKKPESLS